jgi:branched-chain amino acid transport system permease protein
MKWDKLTWLTGGPEGLSGFGYDDVPTWPILGELRGREGRAVFSYWLAVVLLVVSYLVCRGIVKSRVGRSLIAIRDNETAAAVMGVHRAATKTMVFGVSAAMCAVAGSVAAVRLNLANPDIRNVTLLGSITFLLIMVLGGAATLWGPIIGAFAFVLLDTRTREAGVQEEGIVSTVFGDWLNIQGSPATLVLAILIMIVIFVAPFGLVGLLKRLTHRFVVIVPRPAGSAEPTHVLAAEAQSEVEEAPAS